MSLISFFEDLDHFDSILQRNAVRLEVQVHIQDSRVGFANILQVPLEIKTIQQALDQAQGQPPNFVAY